MDWKRCSKCNNLKRSSEFYESRYGKYGICKDCLKKSREPKKELKKLYDKKHYIKKVREVCSLCKKHYSNVELNSKHYCLKCLKENTVTSNLKVVSLAIRKIKKGEKDEI